jgi:hypothetical protein
MPAADLGRVDADFEGVVLTGNPLIEKQLAHARAGLVKPRNPIDPVDRQAEAIGLVPNGQFERGVDVALLLVTPDVGEWDLVCAPEALR